MKNLIDIIQEKLIISKTGYKHPEEQYFYHEALEDGYITEFMNTYNVLQYSIDNCKTWHNLEPDMETPEINKRDRIFFKGENLEVSDIYGIGSFGSNKKFNTGGNIMSLIYGDDFIDKKDLINMCQFKRLFQNNKYLISVKDLLLLAMKLTESCYEEMFMKCLNLVNTPILPATNLAKLCYYRMFIKCTSLTKAPKLPATELAEACYCAMFNGCTSLVNAPELPATKLEVACYKGMFADCTSLIKAPKLCAKQLEELCYMAIFSSCNSLKNITMLATDISADMCLDSFADYIRSTQGTFTKAKGVHIPSYKIPDGWTVKEI